MILDDKYGDDYLEAYRNREIQQGLDIGHEGVDDYVRFKQGQFIMINGLDNVGKSIVLMWYFLCLSAKHGLKWDIWAGENKPEKQKREIIEMLGGKKLYDMSPSEVDKWKQFANKHFNWVSVKNSYTHDDLFKIFQDTDSAGALIDPYTGLKRGFGHEDNYGFLNGAREMVNSTDKCLYLCTHPNSDAARRTYPKDHALAGYPMPPGKAEVEGGQPFASRADDFWTMHRLVNHRDYWSKTLWYVRKVKDTDSGGKQTFFDAPIKLEWNSGLGFLIEGEDGAFYNPLKGSTKDQQIKMSAPLNPSMGELLDDDEPEIYF